MKRSATFILNGNPTPLARHRTTKTHTFYDPQKNAKLIHGITIRTQFESQGFFSPFLKPLTLEASFFMEIPAYKKKLLLHTEPHFSKPDLDNLLKFICDICNTIVYHDDAQIYLIHTTKYYDKKPRTEFIITEAE